MFKKPARKVIFFLICAFLGNYSHELAASTTLEATPQKPDPSVSQKWPLPKSRPSVVTVSGIVEGLNIQSSGDDGKGVAYAAFRFFNKKGEIVGYKKLNEWLNEFDWRPWSSLARIPQEATEMELILGMEGATGKVFFDHVEIFPGFPDDLDRENFLVDGGFEFVNPLSTWRKDKTHEIIYPGLTGRGALYIHHSDPDSSSTDQEFLLPKSVGVKTLECSLDYKLERVEAGNLKKKDGALVLVEFFDQEGKSLQKETVLEGGTGNADWRKIQKDFSISQDAVRGKLSLKMEKSKGELFFDNVRLEEKDRKALRPLESKTDTSTWIPFGIQAFKEGGPLDASRLLDPPAGKHGFLQAKGERFLFEDGTPIRFLGVNIQAENALPSHREAKQAAAELSRLGVNIVRLHHLDAPWSKRNLFDQAFDDTQHLSKESLNRLDFFIAQLKAKGIYVYLDLLVSRQFKKKDKVPNYGRLVNGAKMVAEFNPWIIELQKKFAQDLLTHYNPYTKTRLIDEPAIALLDLINESSLFKWPKDKGFVPEIYVKELEDLAKGVSFTDEFFAQVQSRYFKEMSDFLRGLGLKIPIAGSNLPEGKEDLETNAQLDFIDRHRYWDHPQGGFGDLVKFNNRSLLESKSEENPLINLSKERVHKKPLVVGEWNIPWPNELRAQAPLLAAACAQFKDWNGILLFNYNTHSKPARIEGNFDIRNKPEMFLQLPGIARFFYREDVRPGQGFRWDEAAKQALIETGKTLAFLGGPKFEPFSLGEATLEISNPFAAVILTTLDDEPVKKSHHLLLTTVARSENEGTVYNATRTLLREAGDAPILMEPVRGSLTVQNSNASQMRVFALDSRGARSKEITAEKDKKAVKFPLGEAFIYEISS